jgi:hypothetical protein
MKGIITSARRKPARIVASLTFFLSVLLFASCSKDEPVQPVASTNETNNSARMAGIPEPVPGDLSPKTLMPAEALIYINHGTCLKNCPAYSVTLTADGHVIYKGYSNTGTLGSYKFTISREQVSKLVNDMISNGFLKLENFYPSSSPDDAMNVTALRVNVGTTNPKIVVDYGVHVPVALTDLRTRIETELGIDKLVRAETAPLDLPSTVLSGQ